MTKIERWSATTVTKSQSCLRQLKYEKIDRFIPRNITSSALVGILSHVGVLEGHLKMAKMLSSSTEGLDPPEADIHLKARELEILHDISVSQFDIERACIYSEALTKTEHWKTLTGLTILHIEHKFEVELLGHKFVGVFDAIGYDPKTDTHYVIELKTTGADAAVKGAKSWWETKQIANQPIIYMSGLKKLLGKDINVEMMYVVIKTSTSKPKLRPGVKRKKDELKEDYELRKQESTETFDEWSARLRKEYQDPSKFALDTVIILDRDIESRLSEIGDVISMVNSQTSYPRNPGNCGSFGGCAFIDVCLGNSNLATDSNLIKLKDKSKVQEEVPF